MPDGAGREPSGSDGDEFDRIVERLDWDLPFPTDDETPHQSEDDGHEQEGPVPVTPAGPQRRSPDPVDEDEHFYRRVQPVARPWRRNTMLAWLAVIASPVLLVLASTTTFYVPQSVMAGLALLFLAGAAYLITNLPEHGPADDDDPDDGAVL